MRLAVIGSQKFSEPDLVRAVLNDWLQEIIIFISRREPGVETIAEDWIDEYNAEIIKDSPEFCIRKLIIDINCDLTIEEARNKQIKGILNNCDCIIVFWNGMTDNIAFFIDEAIKAGKPMDIFVRT